MPHAAIRPEALVEEVAGVVKNAGRIVAANIGQDNRVRSKGRANDLVTEIDLKSEAYLKERLARVVPQAGFLAEESGEGGPEGLEGLAWVIDPLDGTTNYAHGLPFVAVSVALCQDGEPLVAVVDLPVLGELFTAARGAGAWLNGDPVRVSDTGDLEHALVATGFPYAVPEHLEEILDNLRAVLPRVRGVRRAGAAVLDLAYTACGRFDGFYESALNPWDTAAGILLVTEAGGRVTRYDGTTPHRLDAPAILASNGRIHEDLAALLREQG